MNRSAALLLFACLVAPTLGSGCSLMQSWKHSAEEGDVGRQRERRREEVVQDFERRRSSAQLLAAQEHAEQGDPEAAEKMLLSVIQRDPQNAEPRVRLAELYWAHEQLPKAEEQLRAAVDLAPDRADVHHSLGLVLEAGGDTTSAREHLAKAAQLEPANEFYRLAVDVAGTAGK
jgi:Tfp pilus assembly protein PilF